MDCSIGSVKLEKKIGEGTFGVVYRVLSKDNIKYALKIEKIKGSLTNEIKILKLLNHISIPSVVNSGSFDGYNFIIIPLYKISMIQILATQQEFFTSKVLAAIAWNLVNILEYIHSKDIIYRDLKPENIMLGFDSKIYLVDFGLSTIKNETVISNRMVGTPRYISLDAHNGYPPSAKNDLESLFYVLILLMTGSLPWINEKDILKIKKLKEEIEIDSLVNINQERENWIEFMNTLWEIKGEMIDYYILKEMLVKIIKIGDRTNNNREWIFSFLFCC